jgi:DNA-binding response OmpR family regulator
MLMAMLAGPTPKTILLVESDPMLLKFVHRLLEGAGFTVLRASTAEEALSVYAGHGGGVDLLLTGFSMPRFSGAELAVRLDGLTKLRVILMSSQPDASRIASDHGWYFIEKPFSPLELLGRVREALGIEVGVSVGSDNQL